VTPAKRERKRFDCKHSQSEIFPYMAMSYAIQMRKAEWCPSCGAFRFDNKYDKWTLPKQRRRE
jgi:hypothetical protein